jgi:hypothetical protein
MDKKGYWIILVLLFLLLSFTTWCYFSYTYHERDESYVNLNGIYIKCITAEKTWTETIINCSIPNGTLQIVKSINYNSRIR